MYLNGNELSYNYLVYYTDLDNVYHNRISVTGPGLQGKGVGTGAYCFIQSNRKYIISVSYLFEHISHINPKKLLILVSALVGINYDSNSI